MSDPPPRSLLQTPTRAAPATLDRNGQEAANGTNPRTDGGELPDAAVHRDDRTAPPSSDLGFASALRGYDRGQVDARIAEFAEFATAETRRADAAEAALRAAEERLRQRAETGGTDSGGFGVRVERLLIQAEREAAELRAKAAADATELIESTRAEAEQHRHEAEQALIARASAFDQELAQRTAILNQREREIVEKRDAAGQEAESILTDAERDATAELAKADKRAQLVLAQAELTVRLQREAATREVERIRAVQDGIRAEMTRIHQVLEGEIGQSGSSPAPGGSAAGSTTDLSNSRHAPGSRTPAKD